MSKLLRVFLVVTLILESFSKPVEDNDYDAVVLEADDTNSIDGDGRIDLSHFGPEAYGMPKNESGEALSEWTESSLMNPEELGEYAEGDILIPTLGRNGMRAESSRWDNGIIPYTIEGYYNAEQRNLIMQAIADYHRLTCLRFVPYKGEKDYLVIKSSNTGCWSTVGRMGGRQEVNLQNPGCVSKKGTILHELLHAVGFMHEQSRPERDDFVDIIYRNIKPGAEGNFKKADRTQVDGYSVPYDYNSVMHYSEYAFSRNSQRTIVPKIDGVKLGQREGLSRGDVRKVNNMYNCQKEEPQQGWVGAIWNAFFGGKNEDVSQYQ